MLMALSFTEGNKLNTGKPLLAELARSGIFREGEVERHCLIGLYYDCGRPC